MSLSIALSNAISGLNHNQTALQVTSNNIANVNTAGYSRKDVSSLSQVVAGQGAGVFTSDIMRTVDENLLRDLRTQTGEIGRLRMSDSLFSRLDLGFGSPGNSSSVTSAIANFAQAFEALANLPDDQTLRNGVINTGVTLTRKVNDMASLVQDQRKVADQEISNSVGTINTQLTRVAELNQEIARNVARNLPAADLKDERDKAVSLIAEHIDVSYFTRNTGELVLQTRTGVTLVDGSRAQSLSHTAVAQMSASLTYGGGGIDGITVGGQDITTTIQSGRLKGLIDMRDTTLPNLTAQLDTFSAELRDSINAIHNDGAGLPAANALTGTRAVAGTDAFSGTGTVRIAVTDASGNAVGAPLDLDLTALGAVTVQDVADAIDTGLGANGTAAVVNGRLVVTAANGANGIAINEGDSAVGAQGFSHYFGLNDFFVGDDTVSLAGQMAVRADLVTNPERLARGQVGTGAIASGENAVASGDNSIAQRLAAAFDANVSFSAVGGLGATTTTLSGYSAEILNLNAVNTSRAAEELSFSQTIVTELDLRVSSQSGVNIDEELADLVVLQNAYAASARVITVTTEMMQLLNEIAA